MPASGFAGADSISAEAVRAEVDRLVGSATLRSSERLIRFLKYVVEQQLAGNGAQVKESVLAVEVFDRDASYDPRVDAVVRVQARRLREKLANYYATEGRGAAVVIGLPKGGYLPTFLCGNAVAPEQPGALIRAWQRWPVRLLAAAVVVGIVATMAITHWLDSRGATPFAPLRRLTSDPGLTFQPALSRDGRLVAYASDRGGNQGLDIWVQQVPAGLPVRLTDNPADDLEPSFSPDGTAIAYRAEGEADGVYLVPALGGKRTLLARGGYRPRFSPDGTRIAYWTGERSIRTAKIFLVPSNGGNSVQFQPAFRYAAYPIWSPDGRRIAFVGSKGRAFHEMRNDDDWDWWVAPLAGGPAVPVLARKALDQQGLGPPEARRSHLRIVPDCWTASGHLVFSARAGDQVNIWRLPISAKSWQASGPAEQVTFGNGRQDNPSIAADGALAFSVLNRKSDVWGLPIHADTAEPRGAAIRLTSGEGDDLWPAVSRDGSRLAFVSNRTGNNEVWVKDLKTEREKALTEDREEKVSPIFSPDGSTLAFGYPPPHSESIFLVPFAGGKITQLCSDCGEQRAWLADGSGLVYQKLPPEGGSQVGIVDLSGRATPLLQSPDSALYSSSVTRDGKWLALIVRTPPNDHRIMVVPLRDRSAAARADWISVSEPGAWVDKPRWSPDGNLLYHVSDRDGFVCIWASRLDPLTKKPIAPPKPVAHFHASNHSIENVYRLELSVADDKLVFNVGENAGNIWLAPAGR